MTCSIIIVNYNGLAHTREAITSVVQHSQESETIVVDNCSSDGSVEALRTEFPQIKLVASETNRGFGSGCNLGALQARGEYLFFLNNDALLSEDTPAVLRNIMKSHPRCGACGPRVVNPDGSYQLSFGRHPSLSSERNARRLQRLPKHRRDQLAVFYERQFANKPVDWISGAALMVRRDAFLKIGGFDESYFMYFEDADLCKRIRDIGMEVIYFPKTTLIHKGGESYPAKNPKIRLEYRRSQLRIYDKSRSLLTCLLIRCYIFVKFFPGLMTASERQLSLSVMGLLLKDQGR